MKKFLIPLLLLLLAAMPAGAAELITGYAPSVREVTDGAGFVHPGITVNKADLDRMQSHVRAGDEPWASAFDEFAALPQSSRNPRVHYGDASDQHDYENISDEFVAQRLRFDSDTCFAQTIMWYITGDDVYRGNALGIIRKWSTVKSIIHDPNRYLIDNEQLHFGVGMYKLTFAAEILRYSDYDRVPDFVWTEADNAAFLNLLELSYPKYNRWWHFMNQHAINNMAFMASAIFRGDREDFAAAVERTTVNSDYDNPRSGSIVSVIREVTYQGKTNLQHCEMGRDQGHAYGDIGALSVCAMTAQRQNALVDPVTGRLTDGENGVTVFAFADHRLLFGGNYISEYNLGFDVPYLPVEVDEKPDAMWYYSINDSNRGLLYPNIGILYNYYKYELGWDMEDGRIKYLARAYELMLPEGASEDFLGCSTLLFSGDAALGTEPPVDLTPDTAYRKQIENRTRAVISGGAETVYGRYDGADMGFVRFDGDGEISFVTDDFYPAYGSLSLRLRTDAPARIEVYNSDTQSPPFAVFDLPSTDNRWVTAAEPMDSRSYWQRMTYFRVETEGRVELDWVEFSDRNDLPSAETSYTRTYSDGSRAYMYSGGQYVVAISSPEAYTAQSTVPMTESDGFVILRPDEVGDQRLYVTVERDGTVRCVCEHIWVFDSVDGLIGKTTVNHRPGGDYTAGSMSRYLAAAQALREAGAPTGTAFVEAAEALHRADMMNREANLPDGPVDGPILHYDFRRMYGDKIADLSPYGNDGTPLGAVVGGGEAVLSDGACILMPQGLLSASDAVTVSVTFESRDERTYAWLWCFANTSDTGYLFFAPNRPDGKSYAAITPASYQSESSVAAQGVPAGRRVTATLVHDGHRLTLYLDGHKAAEGTAALTPAELGHTASNYIGRSVFESDPAFEGTVYDFRVYDRALTAAEVLAALPEESAPVLTLESLTRENSLYTYGAVCTQAADIYAAVYGADGSMLDAALGPDGVLEADGATCLKVFAWRPGEMNPLGTVYVDLQP